MNGTEARLLLSACRREEIDLHDPLFADALDLAGREPALAVWWAEQQALDAILAEKLRALPVPGAPTPTPPKTRDRSGHE